MTDIGSLASGVESYLRALDGQAQEKPPSGTARDATEFAGRLREFEGFVRKQGEVLAKRVACEAFIGLVNGTPVDTGNARRNWRIGNGGDPVSTIAAMKPGDRLSITNPTPYMEALERGHSKQAPAGWIQRVLDRVVAKFRGGRA